LDYLTTDQERLKYLKATPKRIEATGPQMAAMLDRGEKLIEADFVADFVDHPVACFHGTGDLINAFRGTAQFFDLLTISDKKLYSYPEYYHDLFHETRERVDQLLNDTYEWLDAHTSSSDVEVTHKETAKVIETAEKVQHEGPAEVEPQTTIVSA
jgi:alpha-beta hydrolase superfamily lysophospholipase